MTYLARLREQSGVRIADGGGSRAATPPAAASPAAAADLIESVDVVEVVAPSAGEMTASAFQHPAPAVATPATPAAGRRAPAEPVQPRRAAPAADAGVGPRTPGGEPSALSGAQVQPTDVVEETVSLEPLVVDAQAALRHVFRWIAAGPAPDAPVDERMGRPSEAAATPRPITAPAGDDAAAVAAGGVPPRAVPAARRVGGDATAVSVRVAEDAGGVAESAEVRVARRDGDAGRGRVPADAAVEETLTVSIGTIHVSVDAPAPAAAPAVTSPARAAAPAARPAREARRQASRLSRHYLRP